MDGGSWYYTGGSDQDNPQEKERQNGCLRRPYKQLRKEKLKEKEKRKDILIWMQSFKEEQGEIRKLSSVISAKKLRKTIE